MPRKLKLGVAQTRTLETLALTLDALERTTHEAARLGIDLILFPEAYLGGYPRSCSFGSTVGARSANGKDQFLQHFRSAVDLGDTVAGAGNDWVERTLPVAKGARYRGDGIREALERIAKETGVFVITGLVEKCGGSLYCAAVYVCPKAGILGKRRKVAPTGSERLVWNQGSPSTLRAVTTTIADTKLTLAAAICWENYMPLLRFSLYSQNVNLYLAPTADARETWLPLMRTIACEGRMVVLSANQCVKRKHLPSWIHGEASVLQGQNGQSRESGATRARRRSSIITSTADKHEICWPIPSKPESYNVEKEEGNTPKVDGAGDRPMTLSRQGSAVISDGEGSVASPVDSSGGRRQVLRATKTEANHEIAWPDHANGTKQPEKSASFEQTSVAGDEYGEEFVCRGGSCIIGPTGDILTGPLWDNEEDDILFAEVDFEDCVRGKMDLDVAGSYSRNDSFKLTVAGLDITPPP